MDRFLRPLTGRIPFALTAALALPALSSSAPLAAQEAPVMQPSPRDGVEWDQARASLVAQAPGQMAQAVQRWELLTSTDKLGFDDYAGFLTRYPGFPQEAKLRGYAEGALDRETVSPDRLAAYFDKFPPLTNPARARYALALATLGRSDAGEAARAAWRGGKMDATQEAYIFGTYGSRFTAADHDARMEALLWQGDADGASREIIYTSGPKQSLYLARLSLLRGAVPESAGLTVPGNAIHDPGFVWNLVKFYRKTGQYAQATQLLATRPDYTSLPFDAEDMVGEMLRTAKGADARSAARIAASVDDLFAPGTDIRGESYRTRDDYTSLMWLGGTKALWDLGDGAAAAPLFYRYGAAARTPQTRSKGFYWAGKAARMAGDNAGATRYWQMAATYPDRFYGMLALKALGQPMPDLHDQPHTAPTQAERAAFASDPLVLAVREVARTAPWRTGIQFYNTIADRATSEAEHVLVLELAQQTGRRDLAVILSSSAEEDGHKGFTVAGFPTLP
ncbi:MAG: lytic transglycosylase domain-containing protein, partial [Sphingomonadales bacterium]|nr:lytic transglycosylase domain-containing protein [Sphingomonadales bacterium]MBD3775435.1 lytic transglycosylase domain-containing protein [Paracoccaceae bacterium]